MQTRWIVKEQENFAVRQALRFTIDYDGRRYLNIAPLGCIHTETHCSKCDQCQKCDGGHFEPSHAGRPRECNQAKQQHDRITDKKSWPDCSLDDRKTTALLPREDVV